MLLPLDTGPVEEGKYNDLLKYILKVNTRIEGVSLQLYGAYLLGMFMGLFRNMAYLLSHRSIFFQWPMHESKVGQV